MNFSRLGGLVTALAVLALACQDAPTGPVVSTESGLTGAAATSVKQPFVGLAFVPCAIDGAGEFVSLSGTLHVVTRITIDANGGFHGTAHFNPQGVKGVGLTSGDTYQGNGVTKTTTNIAGAGFPFTETFVNNFRIIGPGPDNNLLVHQTIHLTINANGDVTADVFVDSAECR